MKRLIKKVIMEKGINTIFLMVITTSMLFLSCSKEFDPAIGTNGTVRLDYSFNTSDLTRANATEEENNISKICLLFYNNETGTYLGSAISVVNSSGSSSGSSSFKVPDGITAIGMYKVLAMVSGDSQFYEGSSVEEFMNNVSHLSYSEMKATVFLTKTAPLSTFLPFCCDGFFDYGGSSGISSSLSVVFTRTVAKITLVNETDNFRLKWAKVGVYKTSGYMFHQDQYKNKIELGTGNGIGIEPVGRTITEGLYAFPNIVAVTAQNDKETTCLIVAGYYSETPWGSDLPQGEPTYYRINISRGNGKSQLLKRNNQYNITIKSVSGHGESSEAGAIVQSKNKINVSINDWDAAGNDDEIIITPEGHLSYTPAYLDFQSIVSDVRYVDIKVKEGTYWDWTLTSGAEYFTVKKDEANINRLSVKTAQDGDKTSTRFGKIEIKVYKSNVLPKEPLEKLEGVVNLIQYSKSMDNDILSVDGKFKNFAIEANGSGDIFKFEVLTGSQQNLWVAEPNLAWCSGSTGGNGSILTINVDGNMTEVARTVELTVRFSRDNVTNPENGTTPPPIKITITQKSSGSDLFVYPAYSADQTLVVEGINLGPKVGGGGSAYFEDILVNTIDPNLYTHYKVTSSFPIKYVSISAANALVFGNKTEGIFNSGSHFRLMIKQTIPMSDILKGNITIAACDNLGVVLAQLRSYTFPVEIISDHVALPKLDPGNPADTTGHAWFNVDKSISTNGKMYIYDRNAGVPLNADYLTTKPYTNLYANTNIIFKGPYVSKEEVVENSISVDGFPVSVCQDGWTIPTKDQWKVIADRVTAADNNLFGISDGLTEDKKPIAFLIPLSGASESMPSSTSVGYRIKDIYNYVVTFTQYGIFTNSVLIGSNDAVVRCVHVLPPPPPSPPLPIAKIK